MSVMTLLARFIVNSISFRSDATFCICSVCFFSCAAVPTAVCSVCAATRRAIASSASVASILSRPAVTISWFVMSAGGVEKWPRVLATQGCSCGSAGAGRTFGLLLRRRTGRRCRHACTIGVRVGRGGRLVGLRVEVDLRFEVLVRVLLAPHIAIHLGDVVLLICEDLSLRHAVDARLALVLLHRPASLPRTVSASCQGPHQQSGAAVRIARRQTYA